MYVQLNGMPCLIGLLVLSLGNALETGYAVASETCAPIPITERGSNTTVRSERALLPRITIEKPGRFCLEEDVHQASLVDPVRSAEVFAQVESIVRIRANDVTINLAKHTVSNEMRPGMTMIWFSRFARGKPDGTRLRRARISNGRLVSPGAMGVGIDLLASKPYGTRSLEIAPLPDGAQLEDRFEDTRHLIDFMIIVAGKRGIQIDGKNNVIRNNRIVVDSATAIVAQGPGTVIENNIIEVRNNLSFHSDQDRIKESRTLFPIRLLQADGAIVRNNQIRLINPASATRLTAAIELVESNHVVLEGNRFHGIENLVHSDAKSSHRDDNNRRDHCPPTVTRFLPPDETVDAGPPHTSTCR